MGTLSPHGLSLRLNYGLSFSIVERSKGHLNTVSTTTREESMHLHVDLVELRISASLTFSLFRYCIHFEFLGDFP